MIGRRYILTFAAVLTGAGSAFAGTLNPGGITCGGFLASGQPNMAAVIMWLRGYHAAKSGITAYQTGDPYGGRLGYYCRQHPGANLVDASEQILTALDQGI